MAALGIVAVEQPLRRFAADDQRELPGEIVGVLDARIAAAGAARRHLMRRTPDEDDAAVAELFQPAALERIDAHPFEFEFGVVAEHGAQSRQNAVGLALEL